MASSQSHIDFVTFLEYHGTGVADSQPHRYLDMFDNFSQFRSDNPHITSFNKAFIKWNQQYQPTPAPALPYLTKEILTFPYQSTAYSNTPPIIVLATSTTTTTLMDQSNKKKETQAEQAINQLLANYLDEDIPYLLTTIEPEPLDSPTSSLASISPPPELKSMTPQPNPHHHPRLPFVARTTS
jgi:hypothetical protein